MTPRVFIDGEAGTTGLQIKQRLEERIDIELLSIPDALRKDSATREKLLKSADVAILCLPDDAARDAAALLSGADTRIIDASTAFRIDPDWAYGFPELRQGHDETIAQARLVSNPGCYPTGVIAMLRPLIARSIVPADYPVAVHAVSGYSGGGRQLIEQFEDADAADPISQPFFLYGLDLAHKHTPEMLVHSGLAAKPLFVPSVARYRQGMIVQIGLHISKLKDGATAADIRDQLAEWYDGRRHISVEPLNHIPEGGRLDPERFNGTNDLAIHVFASPDGDQCLLAAVYDNLGKGASGAAVQNLNLMLELDPTIGLSCSAAA